MNSEYIAPGLKRALVPLVCSATLIIPALVWLISVGDPLDYFENRVPPGQTLYVISKLCGLIALALFWLQCMTALAQFSPALRGWVHKGRRRHAVLGVATFLLVVSHLTLFVGASAMRTDHLALTLLLPHFDSGFFSACVSLGAIAFWLLGAVVIAGWRRSRGHACWRWLHHSAFAAFAFAFLHGISVGSETRFGLMAYGYAFMGLSLAAAACSWILLKLRNRFAPGNAASSAGSIRAASGVSLVDRIEQRRI